MKTAEIVRTAARLAETSWAEEVPKSFQANKGDEFWHPICRRDEIDEDAPGDIWPEVWAEGTDFFRQLIHDEARWQETAQEAIDAAEERDYATADRLLEDCRRIEADYRRPELTDDLASAVRRIF